MELWVYRVEQGLYCGVMVINGNLRTLLWSSGYRVWSKDYTVELWLYCVDTMHVIHVNQTLVEESVLIKK